MKIFLVIVIAIYLIIVVIDLVHTLKNENSIGNFIFRCIMIHPMYISFAALIVFAQIQKPRIYKEGDLYGVKSYFERLVSPNYAKITKEMKIIDYAYEIDCESEGYKAKKADVFYLTDKNNKLSVWCEGNIIMGDSMVFLIKNLIIGKESLPIDAVLVYKGKEKDTFTFTGEKIPIKIDSVNICSPIGYWE